MTIIRSAVMGFCSGVQRAVVLLEKAAEQGRMQGIPVYTIGPLIHNEVFLASAEKKGVVTIYSPEGVTPGIAVIRAHGIPPEMRESFSKAGFTLVDGTCSRVRRSQRLVASYTEEGSTVLIAGDAGHGEVVSLVGFAKPPGVVHVIQECFDISSVKLGKRVLLIAQTTFSSEQYQNLQGYLSDRAGSLGVEETQIFDSICPATKKRQEALISLTKHVHGVIVVGGKDSANTNRLFEIVEERNIPAWHITDADEVTDEMTSFDVLGVTAGASTPDWVIDEVISRLRGERT